jgi:hypothetical protein
MRTRPKCQCSSDTGAALKWNENTLIIFGAVIGVVIGAVYDEAAGGAYYKFLLGTDGRLQWEILATGIAALVAAWWTVAKISDQIKQTEWLATDQRRRRERAALAMLPLALSEFANYATACINGLYALRPCFQTDGSLDQSQTEKPLTTWSAPRLPRNVLALLKECIEFADAIPAETMAELIRKFQVQNFRLIEDLSRLRLNDGIHVLLWANIEQAMRDAAEVYARAAVLFPFSRGDQLQSVQPDRHLIHTALSAASCFSNLHEIEALVDAWLREYDYPMPAPMQRGASPGEAVFPRL